jgi:signal transduction histidine kinase
MLRLHAERGINITSSISSNCAVRAQQEDVEEMLGNLLDNACKWAKSRVAISASEENANLVITVDDDGMGLDPCKRDVVLNRGERADESSPGSGLGLAIVRDLAELYDGTITLESSPLGGLRARLRLPKA